MPEGMEIGLQVWSSRASYLTLQPGLHWPSYLSFLTRASVAVWLSWSRALGGGPDCSAREGVVCGADE